MEKSQYKSSGEWYKADPKAYNAAYRKKLLPKIVKMFGWSYRVGNFLPFEEARTFIHSLKLKNQKEWEKYCKSGNKPDNIPVAPREVYKNIGWVSLGDWLGTGYVDNKKYRSFEEAREFVRSLKIKNRDEWMLFCRTKERPDDIPFKPNRIYKDIGWVSMGDWLGTKIGFSGFLPFEDARKFIHFLNIKSQKYWAIYCKSGNKPDNIPASPREVYKNTGWVSWGDWFGTNTVANFNIEYLLFKESREFVHKLKLENSYKWFEYCKSGEKPNNIPSCPNQSYKNKGWISYGDWLGTKIGFSGFLPFEDARKFVHKLKLKGQKEWKDYCKSGKRPNNIPVAPREVYKNDGWISDGDWLGTGIVATQNRTYLSFKEAREFVHTLKLKGQKEWREYCKSGMKPSDVPNAPNDVYKDDWVSMGDWLGTGVVASKNKTFLSFEEARTFIRELNLKKYKEWLKYCKSGMKPIDIPTCPDRTYKSSWLSWRDFLTN